MQEASACRTEAAGQRQEQMNEACEGQKSIHLIHATSRLYLAFHHRLPPTFAHCDTAQCQRQAASMCLESGHVRQS